MWTKTNRGQYDRSKLRYPIDLTDEEWQLVEPLIPTAKRGGRSSTVKVRDVIDGLMYRLQYALLVAIYSGSFPTQKYALSLF
jgi:transposase